MINFTIPGKPVPQARPRFFNGHAYDPKNCKMYKRVVANCARIAMGTQSLIEGAVAIYVEVYVQIPKSFSKKARQDCMRQNLLPIGRPDLDNIFKAISDSMIGVVYVDDSQIVSIVTTKTYAEEACVKVAVTPVQKVPD